MDQRITSSSRWLLDGRRSLLTKTNIPTGETEPAKFDEAANCLPTFRSGAKSKGKRVAHPQNSSLARLSIARWDLPTCQVAGPERDWAGVSGCHWLPCWESQGLLNTTGAPPTQKPTHSSSLKPKGKGALQPVGTSREPCRPRASHLSHPVWGSSGAALHHQTRTKPVQSTGQETGSTWSGGASDDSPPEPCALLLYLAMRLGLDACPNLSGRLSKPGCPSRPRDNPQDTVDGSADEKWPSQAAIRGIPGRLVPQVCQSCQCGLGPSAQPTSEDLLQRPAPFRPNLSLFDQGPAVFLPLLPLLLLLSTSGYRGGILSVSLLCFIQVFRIFLCVALPRDLYAGVRYCSACAAPDRHFRLPEPHDTAILSQPPRLSLVRLAALSVHAALLHLLNKPKTPF